jgi:acyl carrier protein
MASSEILARLTEALAAENIPVDGDLTPETSLDDDLGLDSFQLMKVARHLERAYEFKFSIADWVLEEEESGAPTYTVGALVNFVSRSLTGA